LIAQIQKSLISFSRAPFPFVWSSVVYVIFQLLFLFAAVGIFLIYFLLASVLNVSTSLSSVPTMAALGVAFLIFLFFSCGLNAGLAKAYASAVEGRKTTMADFMRYSLFKSPITFVIMLIRDVATLIVASPGIAIYVLVKDVPYLDIISMLYILFVVFIVHFLFTPAFISAGAFSTSLVQSLRNGANFLRRRHINALGLYIIFALVWLLSFIPILQLVTLFAIYPIIYSAFIVMFQDSRTRW
jgi:hypothetical protein